MKMLRYLRSLATWCLVLAVLVFPSIAGAAVYTLVDYPLDQNGYTVSGTIETDGTIGALNASNIIDFSIQISGPAGASLELFDFGYVRLDEGTLFATASDLIFASYLLPEYEFSIGDPDGFLLYVSRAHQLPETYSGNVEARPSLQWDTVAPQMNGTSSWVIATTVPEPSMALLLGFGVGGLAALQRAKKR